MMTRLDHEIAVAGLDGKVADAERRLTVAYIAVMELYEGCLNDNLGDESAGTSTFEHRALLVGADITQAFRDYSRACGSRDKFHDQNVVAFPNG